MVTIIDNKSRESLTRLENTLKNINNCLELTKKLTERAHKASERYDKLIKHENSIL